MLGGAEPHGTAAARAAPHLRARRAALAVLSGVAVHLAVGTGTPSLVAAAIAIAALGAAAHRASPLRAAGWGLLSGVVAMATSLSFLVDGLRLAGAGTSTITLAFGLAAALHAVRFAVAAAGAAALGRSGAPPGIAVAAAWLVAETIDVAPLPWSLGAAAIDLPSLTVLAPIAGPAAAALAPCLLGAGVLDVVARRRRAAALTGASLVLLLGAGAWRVAVVDGELAAARTVRVGVVHGVRRRGEASAPPVDERRGAERAVDAGARLIALPEATLAVGRAAADDATRAVLGDLGVPVAVGVIGGHPARNAIAVLDRGHVTLRDKVHPFPGGESTDGPWAWLGAPAGAVARGAPTSPVVVMAGRHEVRIATAVCWDDLFAVDPTGVDLVVVAVNDGWFEGTDAGEAHLLQARLRAVVTGRPVARAANLGPTVILDPLGRVIGRAPATAGGHVVADVAIPRHAGASGRLE